MNLPQVLLIEDHEALIKALPIQLRGKAQVFVATNVRKAESLFDLYKDTLAAVAIDSRMPFEEGGEEIVLATRALTKKIVREFPGPKLAISSYEHDRAELMALGCTDFCIEKREVRACIEKALGMPV